MGTSVQTVRWPVQKLARVGRPFRRSVRIERTSSQLRSTGADRLVPAWPRRPARRGARSAGPAARRRAARSPSGSRRSRASVSAQLVDGRGCRRARRAPSAAGRGTRPGGRPARCRRCRRRRAGASPPKSRCRSSAIVTPSRIRSRPACQVLASMPLELERARGASASKPQRTNAPSTHSSRRDRSSSLKRNRRRTGSRPARSSTSVAVIRAVASSSTSARTPITGLVWRRERSASRISSVRVGSVGLARSGRARRTSPGSAARSSRCRGT